MLEKAGVWNLNWFVSTGTIKQPVIESWLFFNYPIVYNINYWINYIFWIYKTSTFIFAGIIELNRDKYELNVTATDDGKCCLDPGSPPVDPSTKHTSTAVVVVFITDVNDNKPVFEDCSSYSPKVEEGAPNGSPVIKVHAVDKDKGVNGQVRYSVVQQPNQKG